MDVSCYLTVDNKLQSTLKIDAKRQHKDVCVGMTYQKKAARYVLSGIQKELTYDGTKSYIENKGVHISHLSDSIQTQRTMLSLDRKNQHLVPLLANRRNLGILA